MRPPASAPGDRSRAMKRIIFLNRFFHPDHSATSQILSDLAFHLVGCGYEVCVVTSRQRLIENRRVEQSLGVSSDLRHAVGK